MIKGRWYAKGVAVFKNATLQQQNKDSYLLEVQDHICYTGKLSTLNVSDRLGNVERKITLEDGSVFATADNDAVDQLFKKSLSKFQFIHYLESKLQVVLIAIIVTVIVVFGFFKWGIPWSSEKIAYALPAKTNQLIAGNTLAILDKWYFSESVISDARKREIRQHFKSKLVPLSQDKNITYRLHFRAWDNIPNALALPSGDIILTDRLIELCKTQDEMDSILLHEMGHIEHRHSLRTLIEGSITSIAVMMIVGDSNGLADMGVGLGAFMVSSAYSREHELEADSYGFKHMLTAKIDPKSFSDIMSRITSNEAFKVPVNKDQNNSENHNDSSVLDYFSSHPNTQERMKNAQQYSDCFKKGMSNCDITSIPK